MHRADAHCESRPSASDAQEYALEHHQRRDTPGEFDQDLGRPILVAEPRVDSNGWAESARRGVRSGVGEQFLQPCLGITSNQSRIPTVGPPFHSG